MEEFIKEMQEVMGRCARAEAALTVLRELYEDDKESSYTMVNNKILKALLEVTIGC